MAFQQISTCRDIFFFPISYINYGSGNYLMVYVACVCLERIRSLGDNSDKRNDTFHVYDCFFSLFVCIWVLKKYCRLSYCVERLGFRLVRRAAWHFLFLFIQFLQILHTWEAYSCPKSDFTDLALFWTLSSFSPCKYHFLAYLTRSVS